jgi:sodium/bile acid cotransporter 7
MVRLFWKRYWYLFGIVAALLAGFFTFEIGHTLNPSSLTTTAIVVVIFVIAGLTLPSENISRGLRNIGLHLYIQSFTYLIFPLFFVLTIRIFGPEPDPGLAAGILALACLPTTISSCIVFTQSAGGNVVGTMFNASLSNIVGIFLSPLLISLLLTRTTMSLPRTELARVLTNLALKMLLPIAVGQGIRLFLKKRIDIMKGKLSLASRILILLIIYFTIAKAAGNPLFLETLGKTGLPFLYLAVSHLLLLGAAYGGARLLGFSFEDRISVVFTAPQKTIAMGAPLLSTYFAADQELLGVAILPLIFYHSWQLIVAGVLRSFLVRKADLS